MSSIYIFDRTLIFMCTFPHSGHIEIVFKWIPLWKLIFPLIYSFAFKNTKKTAEFVVNQELEMFYLKPSSTSNVRRGLFSGSPCVWDICPMKGVLKFPYDLCLDLSTLSTWRPFNTWHECLWTEKKIHMLIYARRINQFTKLKGKLALSSYIEYLHGFMLYSYTIRFYQ